MKKQFLFLALNLSSLFAAPVLSPSAPAEFKNGVFFNDCDFFASLRIGYRGDFVFNRHLQNSVTSINQYGFFANEGLLILNLWEKVDIYGFLGRVTQNTAFDSYETVQFKSQTIWGGGVKALFFETRFGSYGTTYVALDLNYEGINNASSIAAIINGAPTASFSSRYLEWQTALSFGQRLRYLTPYIAFKYSSARQTTTQGNIYRSSRPYGYAVGANLIDKSRVSITAEARFVDEKAASVEVELRF